MSFNDLGLNQKILDALEAAGFDQPTEIQKKAIPVALAGKDLLASAQTGTGKTAAFVLPSLERLLTPPAVKGRGPRVLVLTPTRELATQVTDVVRQMSRFMRMKVGTIVGGVAYPPQQRLLRAPLDILVATPGRLIDHMNRNAVDFSRLETLVLDEADRMLDMGFVDAVEEIITATPAGRQTLLFSATLEGGVMGVAGRHMDNPERVQLAQAKQRHAHIDQWMHQAGGLKHKKMLLSHLLDNPDMTQAVIFTATKRQAKELSEELCEEGHDCAPLHGDMTQAARRRTVDQMRRKRVRVLVATDVAARGLDVQGISHVINFEMPMVPEDYIHRIGRTGRAGANGVAISLIGRKDWRMLGAVERLTGRQVERRSVPGLEPPKAPTGTGPKSPRKADANGQRRTSGKPNSWKPKRDDEGGRGPWRPSRKGNGPKKTGGFRAGRNADARRRG